LGEDDLKSPVIDFLSHCIKSSKFVDALCKLAVRLVDPSTESRTSLVVAITLAEKSTIWMIADATETALKGSIADAAGMERERGDYSAYTSG
jgi:hypothetical protein